MFYDTTEFIKLQSRTISMNSLKHVQIVGDSFHSFGNSLPYLIQQNRTDLDVEMVGVNEQHNCTTADSAL